MTLTGGRTLPESGLNEDALALALLPLAAACAVTPLSKFNVGAVARGQSGYWYFGANMEFAGATMQQTVHAEQSAVTHARLRGESGLATMTVNYTPCGHCRQFMNELNSGTALRISLPDRPVVTLADYLPDAFGPRDLNITTLVMDKVDHGYRAGGDALAQAAIAAANRSHAPTAGRTAASRCKPPAAPAITAAISKTSPSTPACRRCRRR